jgi:peptidyl-dipeptidase A
MFCTPGRLGATLPCCALLAVLAAGVPAAAQTAGAPSDQPPKVEGPQVPTPADARRFVEDAETRLLELSNKLGRAQWVSANFITEDTEKIAADYNKDMVGAVMELASAATRYDGVQAEPDVQRRLKLLKLAAIPLPAPKDPKLQAELTEIMANLEGTYGKGKYCPAGATGDDCLDIGEITKVMAESRDYAKLLDVWQGWHTISPPMKPKYQRFVELANAGARDLKFPDNGAYWRSNYDMPPDEFAKELDRLWTQVRPLYEALHAHVRAKLREHYGADKVPADGPIPAHLLGNIWAQQWGNVYPLVAPPTTGEDYNLDELLKAKKVDAKEMVRYGERFFTSLGFGPLPPSFWERSLFVQPKDRDVVCHASAWDVDNDQDLRIKMCIEPTGEDFVTIHHELGHNFYQRAYNKQPFLYRNSANDGFHEAIGDAIALSVTPDYLKKVGLLEKTPGTGNELAYLMKMALDKVAFLPFGLVIDKWRWQVFDGTIKPDQYNAGWWKLRKQYQGIAPASPRGEEFFDPGAKYHVPGNTPYMRYFLADILQFQFHRALCREAGFTGPLYQCSIYDNKEAGARLAKMLEMGVSKPWPEALYEMTGERQMDATAILDYFAPLKKWLDEQNKGRPVGWK